MLKRTFKRGMAFVMAALLVVLATACSKSEKEEVSSSTLKLDENGIYPIECEDTLTIWAPLNAILSTSVSNFGDTALAKELEKRTGVKVEYSHPAQGQSAEQFNLMIASNELPDVICYSWYNFGAQAAIDDGYILKLNDLWEKWAPNITKLLKENEAYEKMIKTDEGSYYVFPFFRGDKKDCIYTGPIVRKDWLDKLGMPLPETIEDWDKMLRAFKNELNVDIPISVSAGGLATLFGGAYGIGTEFYIDKNGDVKYGPQEKEYKEFLMLMNKWYEDGILDTNFAQTNSQTTDANMLTNRLGATLGGAAGGIGKWMNAKAGSGEEFELAGAAYPVMKKGERRMFSVREWEYNPGSSYALSAQCKNPELAVRFMDYGYGEEGRLLYNFGIEGESYNIVDGEPRFSDALLNAPEGLGNAAVNYSMGVYSGPFVQDPRVVEQNQRKPEQVREGVLRWADTDAENHMMPQIIFTKEEENEVSQISSELSTYVAEMRAKFIVGAASFDDYDAYLKQIKTFDADRAIEIYTAALKRYRNR